MSIPADAWPHGERLSWSDDTTLTHYDFTTEPHTLTPYSAEEIPAAQVRLAESDRLVRLDRLRDQLATGVAGIIEARAAAAEDRPRAQALRAQAVEAAASTQAQRQSVTGFTPGALYSATQLVQVRNAVADVLVRVEEIQQALADFYAYRVAVDDNAVATDDALLWLARLASGALDDDEGNPS